MKWLSANLDKGSAITRAHANAQYRTINFITDTFQLEGTYLLMYRNRYLPSIPVSVDQQANVIVRSKQITSFKLIVDTRIWKCIVTRKIRNC